MSHCDTCRHLKQEESVLGTPFDACDILSGLTAGMPAYACSDRSLSFVIIDPAAFGCTLHEPEGTP